MSNVKLFFSKFRRILAVFEGGFGFWGALYIASCSVVALVGAWRVIVNFEGPVVRDMVTFIFAIITVMVHIVTRLSLSHNFSSLRWQPQFKINKNMIHVTGIVASHVGYRFCFEHYQAESPDRVFAIALGMSAVLGIVVFIASIVDIFTAKKHRA